MPSLKEVRIRIASVKSTQQITSAMKMVAASKLRKAQNSILKMRPYAAKLKEILQNLSANAAETDSNPYAKQRNLNKALLVVFTSNRGLCGAFNSNVIKAALQTFKGQFEQVENENIHLITIGKKGTEFFTKRGYNVIASYDAIYDNLTWDNSVPIAESIMKLFTEGKYDKVIFVYNQFKNAAVQKTTVENFLPVEAPVQTEITSSKGEIDYLFEPSMEEIVTELIPKSLKIQFYKSLLDSFGSEHGARMTAMHQATDNAGQLLKDLSLAYNKARQASITKEILEIVGGAEALKG